MEYVLQLKKYEADGIVIMVFVKWFGKSPLIFYLVPPTQQLST